MKKSFPARTTEGRGTRYPRLTPRVGSTDVTENKPTSPAFSDFLLGKLKTSHRVNRCRIGVVLRGVCAMFVGCLINSTEIISGSCHVHDNDDFASGTESHRLLQEKRRHAREKYACREADYCMVHWAVILRDPHVPGGRFPGEGKSLL